MHEENTVLAHIEVISTVPSLYLYEIEGRLSSLKLNEYESKSSR